MNTVSVLLCSISDRDKNIFAFRKPLGFNSNAPDEVRVGQPAFHVAPYEARVGSPATHTCITDP